MTPQMILWLEPCTHTIVCLCVYTCLCFLSKSPLRRRHNYKSGRGRNGGSTALAPLAINLSTPSLCKVGLSHGGACTDFLHFHLGILAPVFPMTSMHFNLDIISNCFLPMRWYGSVSLNVGQWVHWYVLVSLCSHVQWWCLEGGNDVLIFP